MKTLLFLSFFILDSLPPTPQLFASLDSFYQTQTTAELSEHQTTNQKQWLKYLPTVGLSYTLDGQPRPTISWSSNLIYTSQKNKESRAAKRKSIIQKNEIKRQKDRLKLNALLQKYQALKEDIQFIKSLFLFEQQFFEVKKDQAEHLEISPVELLKATQIYKQKEYEIFQKERALRELELQILIHAHYLFP